jgi:muconolactone delta-isomerase
MSQTFMVIGTLRPDIDFAAFDALRDAEQKQLEVLRSAGSVGAHYISLERRATFIEFIADDEKQMTETLQTLPFAQFFDVDVYPTTPPDAAELAHRARQSTAA